MTKVVTLNSYLENEINEIVNDISKLVSIETHTSANKNCIEKSFAYVEKMCLRDNLVFKNFDNLFATIAITKKMKMILHHIDTVGIFNASKWNTKPFEVVKNENILYGRGVNDNKGPLVFSYYLLKYMKLQKIRYPIKIVIGSAEESTWEGITHYKKKFKDPKYAISPDGNYPLVNHERGIYQIKIFKTITSNIQITSSEQFSFLANNLKLKTKDNILFFKSDPIKSRNPKKLLDNNSTQKLLKYLENKKLMNSNLINEIRKYFLKGCFEWKKKTRNTLALTHISLKNDLLKIFLDIRYENPKLVNKISQVLLFLWWNMQIIKNIKNHKVSKNSILVKSLMQAYNDILKN